MDQKRIEIRSVIGTAIGITDINDADYFDCAHFLSENKWFGVKPQMESGKYYVSTDEADFLSAKVSHFMSIKDLPQEKKKELLDEEFSRKWPTAYSAFRDFEENAEISDDSAYGVESFLNTFLTKDLDRLMDDDVKVLVRRSFENDYKYIGDGMTFYLAYARSRKIRVNNGNGTIKINKYHTHYNTDFIMQHRVDTTTQKSAYDEEEYLQLIYFLLNPEYIEDREMYKQAANSKNYADTWLYLSLHFITAMRDTNIVLLYHPRLPYPPDEVLERVRTNAYSTEDAKNVSCALMEWMYYLQQKPHKTADTSNVPRVPFFIPVSLEEHFGILFSVCEAHHQLSGLTERDPLIRKIKTYDQINSYMGEEIGSLFLEHDFATRRANKAYMQSLELYADPILSNIGIEDSKNYVLVSLARSHKGGYATFAKTTAEYLKDANFSGLTPEYVAKELFERGVLSNVAEMLLKIVTGGEYSQYTPHEQTMAVKALGMRPSEAEALVKVADSAQARAQKVVDEVLSVTDQEADSKHLILNVLHRLAVGDAPAREQNVYCVYKAVSGVCAYPDKTACELGCRYEIGTKAAAYHLIFEYNRLKNLYNNSKENSEKEKYEWIAKNRILPTINDMLGCIKSQYGQEYLDEFIKIIKENAE